MLNNPILTAEQLACLASPVRNETFVTIRSLGKASVREVAERMGRSPESLHYHVKALLKAGLLREAMRRPTARKPESVYESVAKQYRLPPSGSGPEITALTRRAVVSGLRHVSRGFQAASRKGEEDPSVREYMSVVRATARLTHEDAQKFFALIEAAVKFAKEHEAPDGVRMHWSSVVFPDA